MGCARGHCLRLPSQKGAPSRGWATPPPPHIVHKVTGTMGEERAACVLWRKCLFVLSANKNAMSPDLPCLTKSFPHRAHTLAPQSLPNDMASISCMRQLEK